MSSAEGKAPGWPVGLGAPAVGSLAAAAGAHGSSRPGSRRGDVSTSGKA